MSIEVDDESREYGMQEDGQQYLCVDCPLDEAEDQWPSTTPLDHVVCMNEEGNVPPWLSAR